MSIFGKEYKARKNLPVFHFITRYFPKALVELTKVCVAGNVQHNPELDPTDINWSRGKSTDQLNTAQRHLMDHAVSGPFDEEPLEVQKIIGGNTYHLAKAAWRILAQLELQIERDQEVMTRHLDVPAKSKGDLYQTGPLHSGDTLPDCPICHRWQYTHHLNPPTADGKEYYCGNGHPPFYFTAVPVEQLQRDLKAINDALVESGARVRIPEPVSLANTIIEEPAVEFAQPEQPRFHPEYMCVDVSSDSPRKPEYAHCYYQECRVCGIEGAYADEELRVKSLKAWGLK